MWDRLRRVGRRARLGVGGVRSPGIRRVSVRRGRYGQGRRGEELSNGTDELAKVGDRPIFNGTGINDVDMTGDIGKRSRRGRWIVTRRTAKKRLARSLRRVYQYCRGHRHDPPGVQHRYLCRLLRGHFAYYGIVGNSQGIRKFAYQVNRIWHKWLKRRNGLRRLTWEKFNRLLERLPLPQPRIVQTFGWRS